MTKKLFAAASTFGDRAAICHTDVLTVIEKDISALKTSSHYGEAAKAATQFYSTKLPETDFPIRSLVLVAKAEPIVNLLFCLNGKEISIFTPNSFQKARDSFQEPANYLPKLFNENGYNLKEWGWGWGVPPLKMLAVRSGFAKYGRNNLTYVKGLGSRHSLGVFVSDYMCDDNKIHPLEQMEQCALCSVCLNACPTQAITAERRQIYAERCLTYLNEFLDIPNIREFPDWLDSTAHHGTHGCIRCQQICPANQGAIHIITPVRFDEAETQMILDGKSKIELPEETRMKLEMVGELDYLPILPRNLSAAFSNI